MFYQSVAAPGLRIREAVKDAIALGVFNQMIKVTFFLVAKRFSVTDEKLKVARVRLINMWIVNLIDDSVTESEPETATRMVSCTDTFFRTQVQRGSIPGAPNATDSPGEFIFGRFGRTSQRDVRRRRSEAVLPTIESSRGAWRLRQPPFG